MYKEQKAEWCLRFKKIHQFEKKQLILDYTEVRRVVLLILGGTYSYLGYTPDANGPRFICSWGEFQIVEF